MNPFQLTMKSLRWILVACLPLAAGCGKPAATEDPEAAVTDSLIHISTSGLSASDLTIETVSLQMLTDSLIVNGQIQAKPQNLAHVSTRVSGTIQSVSAVIGDRVVRGQILATLYSPEFSAAQADYLLAHARTEGQSTLGGERGALESVARSARQRLEVLGADPSDLARLDRTHEAIPSLPLRSPISGLLNEVEAGVGRQVAAGTDLFGVANLSSVWAVVDAYERDLGRLRVGQAAMVSATAIPGAAFAARVAGLEGEIHTTTRTLDVRLELANPRLELKPGMFVTARIATGEKRRAILVNDDALQESDGVKLVYVALSDSTFVPRVVEVRPHGGNRTEILSGLRAGERIATRGSFLIRSQASKSQIGGE